MKVFINIGFFLVNIFFSLFLLVLWLRFFLKAFRVSSLHPIHQLINQLCQPLFTPVERIFYPKKTIRACRLKCSHEQATNCGGTERRRRLCGHGPPVKAARP